MLKKFILIFSMCATLSANAFTEKEWVNIIVDTIETKNDGSWSYDVAKLKTFSNQVKDADINYLTTISTSDDVQVSQGAKYLLALEGEKTNKILIDNYIESDDIKNGLYYLNLNFINSTEKDSAWTYLTSQMNSLKNSVSNEFKSCSKFNDFRSVGGKEFTFESYDDFFDKRNIIFNFSNANLWNLEIDLGELEYPVTVTFYDNKYVIHKENDNECLSINESEDYIKLQKIIAVFKQYQKNDELNLFCEDISNNNLLKSRFNYLCI